MQRQRIAHVAQVDELVDRAVGIAGDIHQRAFARGPFVQPLDRHDREKLAERPMVEQRLENGKIAEVLVTEGIFELLDILGNKLLSLETGDDIAADLPIKILDLRLVRQVQHAEREHMLGVLAAFKRVVVGFEFVRLGEVLFDVAKFFYERMFVLAANGRGERPDFFDRPENFHDQNTVMRHDGAAALADDGRMRHLLGVADIGDVIDDVVRVFLQGVIRGAVEIGTASPS